VLRVDILSYNHGLVRSFVLCGQGSSLLWTTSAKTFLNWSNAPAL